VVAMQGSYKWQQHSSWQQLRGSGHPEHLSLGHLAPHPLPLVRGGLQSLHPGPLQRTTPGYCRSVGYSWH
jgi:hypothetical protein